MQITDGVTNLTFTDSDDIIDPIIEKSSRRTGSGDFRCRTILNLLNNNATNYFFTPRESTQSWMTALYPDITFPLNVNVTKFKTSFQTKDVVYFTIKVESTSYV
jgi:hypothetical protein